MSEENNSTTDKLFTALAKAQASITCVAKNREVNAGKYKYSYITLAAVIEHVRKPLTDNGLWFVQMLEADEQGKYRLVTRLTHSSGQYIEGRTPMMVQNADNQQFGSALSYMRRYSLIAMLGVAPDEDDDANIADGTNQHGASKVPSPLKLPKQPAKPPQQDQPDGYEKVLGEGLRYIGLVNDVQGANSMVAMLASVQHIGTSKADLWKALQQRAAVVGAVWNAEGKAFEAKQ